MVPVNQILKNWYTVPLIMVGFTTRPLYTMVRPYSTTTEACSTVEEQLRALYRAVQNTQVHNNIHNMNMIYVQ